MSTTYLYLVSLFLLFGHSHNKMDGPLEGKQMRLLPFEVAPHLILTRNSSGHIVKMKGFSVEVVDWLSKYLKFTYEVVNIKPGIVFDDSTVGPGWKHQTLNGDVDMVVGPLGLAETRLAYLDFSYPYTIANYQLMIPAPKLASNFAAPWKPFSNLIWMLLFGSIPITIIVLSFISRIAERMANGSCDRHISYFEQFGRSADYILQVLLAQGGYCLTQRLSVRLLAAVWCLAALVLVNCYNSIFISFVSATNREPMIKNLEEMPSKPHLTVNTNYGWAVDTILLSADSGIFQYLGNILRKDPSLRCKTTELCASKVLRGDSAFMAGRRPILAVMENDVRTTGQCRFSITKENILSVLVGFAYSKHSPYRQLIDKQMLRLWETGLPKEWDMTTPPIVEKCLSSKIKPVKSPLTLEQMSSVFIIIIGGYALTLFFLLFEIAAHRYLNRRLVN